MTFVWGISLAVSAISAAAWVYLVFGRGFFWQTGIRLIAAAADRAPINNGGGDRAWPKVAAIIPARNEADTLPHTLATVLAQQYPGELLVYLVDDQSDDATAAVVRSLAHNAGALDRVIVIDGGPLPPGWAGKVWALEQGTRAARSQDPEYFWFTDADIAHGPVVLAALVERAQTSGVALVSLMARLHCSGGWERLLVPAFVYFFAKLFPFRWVNDRRNPAAAAAGGCILVERQSLEDAGGMESIRHAIIDDCALANRIKHSGPEGRTIWLGLSQDVRSVRAYDGLPEVWRTVARTAYTQLGYSSLRLLGTVAAMLLVYAIPPASVGAGLALAVSWHGMLPPLALLSFGLAGWLLMAGSYWPMLRWYQTPVVYSALLPLAAVLYTLMTADSARRHWRGQGGAWKGRSYVAYNGRRNDISPHEVDQ